MIVLTTEQLENHIKDAYGQIRRFAEKEGIFMPLDLAFTENISRMGPGPFCYSDGKGYYYGEVEIRGGVKSEKFVTLFDLAYAIFKTQAQMMAINYRSKHSLDGKDPRRLTFPKQIELLRIVGEEYARRREMEIEGILKEAPYKD